MRFTPSGRDCAHVVLALCSVLAHIDTTAPRHGLAYPGALAVLLALGWWCCRVRDWWTCGPVNLGSLAGVAHLRCRTAWE